MSEEFGTILKTPEEILKTQIDANIKAFQDKTANSSTYKNFLEKIINELVIKPRREFQPHVGGWYYCNMVSGTWLDQVKQLKSQNNPIMEEFSDIGALDEAPKHFSHLIKDINPADRVIEYESISGRSKNINLATRINVSGDVSLVWKDSIDLKIAKYHKIWLQYIEFAKKGFIKPPDNYKEAVDIFVDMPYLNGLWVAVLEPFTYRLLALYYFIGLTPTTIPLKEILGTKGSTEMTTYSISYKVVDVVDKFYDINMKDGVYQPPSGRLYEEFMKSFEQ